MVKTNKQTNQQTNENENKRETNKQTLQFCFENVIVPGHRQWGPTWAQLILDAWNLETTSLQNGGNIEERRSCRLNQREWTLRR